MDNRRKHPRIPVTVEVKVSHPSVGEKFVKTRNISDNGLFLLVDPSNMPPIGTVVKGQVQGMQADAPMLDMQIVRVESVGLGLRFVDTQ